MNENFSPKYVSKYNSRSNYVVKPNVNKAMESSCEVLFSPKEVKNSLRKPMQSSYAQRLEKEKMKRV